jgi:hypothetical protein
MATKSDVMKIAEEMDKHEVMRPFKVNQPKFRHGPKRKANPVESSPIFERFSTDDSPRIIEDMESMQIPTRVPLNKSGPKFGFERPAEKIRLPSEGIFLCKGGQIKQLSGPPPRIKPKIELPQVKFGRKIG